MTKEEIKVGTTLTRMLAGTISMKVTVGKIEDGIIHTGNHMIPWEEGWRFRLDTLAEIDEDLGWDGLNRTGSFIKL